MVMEAQTIIEGLSLIGGLVGVWVSLNSRIVKLEVELSHSEKQFDQIMSHLRRIEEKLDGKQDRV